MRRKEFILAILAASASLAACSREEADLQPVNRKVSFDVTVSRGEESNTKGFYDVEDNAFTMDADTPFGLVGVDMDSHSLLVDNVYVTGSSGGEYSTYLDNGLWDIPSPISFSAYYPHVRDIRYGDGYGSYTIPYKAQETEAGPLVSKTVQMALDQMNMIPLAFHHITNDIGYKICDVTDDPQLQGLVHLRKVIATDVALSGIFLNDIALSQGIWFRQGYYSDIVVFEGDAKVGVGSEGELFIGRDALVPSKAESSRYFSIPDEILMGKQTVMIVYDVDGFTVDGFSYPPLKGLISRYSLYGLLPDNVFVYGKQYTFHLGIDLTKVYQAVAFSASVSDWETKIYEDNEDF
ncbi:MAG: hypothetical protein J5669_04325 [Bacteroidales bacterium]|nr:hypothetical protein [Bacteroidales bacterium]